MIELKFRTDLYAIGAVQAAAAAFAAYASIERESKEGFEVLRLTAREGEDEAVLSGELANYVLGATVDGVQSESEVAT